MLNNKKKIIKLSLIRAKNEKQENCTNLNSGLHKEIKFYKVMV